MLSHGCETLAQETIYEKIGGWLREIFGEFAEPLDDAPGFAIQMGSGLVFIWVSPWTDVDAIVCIRSIVVRGATIQPSLMRFLLEENHRLYFGRFGLSEEDEIALEHNLVGSTCDKEELRTAVRLMVSMVDRYDDQIVQQWGGMRASDD
jgi:hypothetical protein